MNWVINKIRGWFKKRKRKELVEKLSQTIYREGSPWGYGVEELGFSYRSSLRIFSTYYEIGREEFIRPDSVNTLHKSLDVNSAILDTCVDFLDGEDG